MRRRRVPSSATALDRPWSSAASFAGVAERHRPEILAYLVRLIGDRHEAEDACQEVFLRAQQAFDRLRPDSNVRAWLYRIATNGGINAARRRTRRDARSVVIDDDQLPAAGGTSIEQRDRLRRVARAVGGLPPKQRAALMLRYFHDLGYAEIATGVGGTETGARANVYQAIKTLRMRLGTR